MQAPSAAATDSPAALPGDNAPFRRSPRRFHFVRAAVIGLAAGLLSVAFRRALAYSESGRGDLVAALHAYPAWGWCVMPVIGAVLGAFVGWLTQRFSPQAAGSGTCRRRSTCWRYSASPTPGRPKRFPLASS